MSARLSLCVAFISTTLLVLPAYLTGGLSPFIRREMGFDIAGIGAAVSLFYAAATVSSIVAGRLGTRFGPERMIAIAAAISAVALLSIGTIASDWASLATFLALAGLGNAIVQPVTSALVVRDQPATREGLSFGILQSAIPSTTLLVGLVLPSVGSLGLNWRLPFLIAGILQLPIIVLAIRYRRPLPPRPPKGTPKPEEIRIDPLPLILLTFVGALIAAPANALGSYYVESSIHSGYTTSMAGAMLVMGSVVGIIARLVWGWIIDRRGIDPRIAMAGLLIAGGIGFGAMVFSSLPPIMMIATLLAFGAGWAWKGLFHLSAVQYAPHAVSSVVGTVQIGIFAGSVVGPVSFGLITQHVSYSAAWLCSAGVFFLATVLLLIQRRVSKRPAR